MMKRRIKKNKLTGICLILCSLYGCGSIQTSETGTETPQTAQTTEALPAVSEVISNLPPVYEYSDGSVTVHATIDLNGLRAGDTLVTASAHVQKMDKDQVQNALWNQTTALSESNADTGDAEYDRNDETEPIFRYPASDPTYGEESRISRTDDSKAPSPDPASDSAYQEDLELSLVDDEKSLHLDPASGRLYYTRNALMPYIDAAFRNGYRWEDYNADLYSLTDELSFKSRDLAATELENLLKRFGLNFEKTCHAYALDFETMKQEEFHLDISDGFAWDQYKDSWSKDDECYYYFMNQTYRGLPVFHPDEDYLSDYGDDYFAPVQAVLSKEGIEHLEINGIYTMDAEQAVPSLQPFETVVKHMCDSYNQIPEADSCEITQAALCYVVKDGQMRPAWVFLGTFGDGRRTQTVMDAQTGRDVGS